MHSIYLFRKTPAVTQQMMNVNSEQKKISYYFSKYFKSNKNKCFKNVISNILCGKHFRTIAFTISTTTNEKNVHRMQCIQIHGIMENITCVLDVNFDAYFVTV